MSSPSPGPNLNLSGTALFNEMIGNQNSLSSARRISTGFINSIGRGGPPIGTAPSGGHNTRSLTPPIGPHQASPNSFLANLSSRLLARNVPSHLRGAIGLSDIFDAASSMAPMPGAPGPGNSFLTGFGVGAPTHPTFGVNIGPSSVGPPSALDLSEFPSLGGSGTSNTNMFSGSTSTVGSNRPAYVGMVKDTTNTNSSSNEFTIHSEDFPALPGSNPNFQIGSGFEAGNQGSVSGLGSGLLGAAGAGGGAGGLAQGLGSGSNSTSLDGSLNSSGKSLVKRGIQTSKDGRVTNIPSGMVTDQFGMVGLLTFIRAAESDPNLVSLALGTDLTTLKLDLNSSENLYSTFPGPWSDQPLKPHEIDFHVPQEYLVNNQIKEKLAAIKLPRYGDDLLFFLFYMFPNDLIQVAAANELYVRDWRYHKDEKVWITRAPGMPPIEKTSTYERGTYYFFDALNWRRVAKEFHLDYDRLENRPATAVFNHGLPLGSSNPSGLAS